ncbi:YdcF family protein [Saccharopolyspora sp. WRP15-2]|uniref:YdcF family protein n=1 Tax=Saccharopolyspora oryzae TaxID=2997343 RepID=A0ABT4V329_9PSEU|nr:YdcF family protein [Saccharopolyspora oryzae]MDA3628371.1 YdcF family protein [Saccharopolyspora oryzae]
MFFFLIAGVLFAIFAVGFLRDRRRVHNGVYLFFALMFLAAGLLFTLAKASEWAAVAILMAVVILMPVMVLVLAGFLIANGVTMLRREGRRVANLLSLAAGVGIIGVIVVSGLANYFHVWLLQAIMGAIVNVLSYVSFLFVCFLLYSFVYGKFPHKTDVDFIVVLGSGLFGSRVPPLLASRLDRAREVFDAERARGRQPLLVTSGGQGPGEDLPEARAMADYLIERGVPAEQILVEDQSRTTDQNLRFSKAIMAAAKPDFRCLVVTNNFHVMRAAGIARTEKVNGQVIGSPTARYYWPSATIREFVAVFLSHKVINGIICVLLILSGLNVDR